MRRRARAWGRAGAWALALTGWIWTGPAPSPSAHPLRLAMFGDSVTQSASAAPGATVPDLTRRALDRQAAGRASWTVVNQGRGRETAGRALRRLRRAVQREGWDWISLAYGLVDAGEGDPARFERDIRRLLDAIAAARPEARVALISTIPIDEARHEYGRNRLFRAQGGANRYLQSELDSRLRKLAIERDLPFIDLRRHLEARPDWPRAIAADGIHPDAAGNVLIGEFIGRALSACVAARELGDPRAGAAETEARSLIREALRLFAASGGRAARRCAELEARAWGLCPYLPEATTVFARLAEAGGWTGASASTRMREKRAAPSALR